MASLTTAAQTAATNAARDAAANAVTALCNNGRLRIYAGTPPANANTALSGNTLLAELTFGATAFGAASSGVATANAIGADTSADATGAPTFFRAFQSDGTTVVFQGTAGASGVDLELSGLSSGDIVTGANVSVSSLTYTQTANF
jgi:hypothetical protein